MTAPLSPARRPRVGLLAGSTAVSSGGVGEAVCALAAALARSGEAEVEIFTVRSDETPSPALAGVPVHVARTYGGQSFGFSTALLPLLRRSRIDVLHVHGLWMYQSIAALLWARTTGLPYVVSPHGMLDPWALKNSGIKKAAARRLYEDRHLRGAAFVHALCHAEEEAIRLAGISAPVVVIPNGVAATVANGPPAPWRIRLGPEARILLFLGRVTAKKQVLELIRAWTRARPPRADWHLVVVGPADATYRESLDGLVAELGCGQHVHIEGAAYGEERAAAYASADAFVLPSLSEGLPMAVLEAFAAGLPALLTPQCNLPEAYAHGCAIEMATTVDGIEQGLRRLLAMPDGTILEMGRKGRCLVSEHYDWDGVARRFATVYRGLSERGWAMIPKSGSGLLKR